MHRAMGIARILFAAALLVTLVMNAGGERLPAPPCEFPAIYSFGDSNSDTGGTSAAFWRIPLPYGSTFFRKPAGRDSDGRLIIDFIAENLGLPYLSAYLDSLGTNFRHGANFAVAGSTIRRQNESVFENGISPFPLDIQTVHFDQFKARTTELFNEGTDRFDNIKLPRPTEFSSALYVIDIGQNDLAAGFRKLSMAQLHAAIPDIVEQVASAITHLYQQGARTFWIHNTGPIGCLPAAIIYFRNQNPGFLDKNGCIRTHNAMAIAFNRQLKARVAKLRTEIPHATLTYVDIYSAKYQLIDNAKNLGFMDPMKICCGRHENDVHVWCGQRTTINGSEVIGDSCGSPASHISWDGVHYTQAANQWTAENILNGSFSDPQQPIANACLKR